jgi:hypothetical protein
MPKNGMASQVGSQAGIMVGHRPELEGLQAAVNASGDVAYA